MEMKKLISISVRNTYGKNPYDTNEPTCMTDHIGPTPILNAFGFGVYAWNFCPAILFVITDRYS